MKTFALVLFFSVLWHCVQSQTNTNLKQTNGISNTTDPATVGTFYISSTDNSYLRYKELFFSPAKGENFARLITAKRLLLKDTTIQLTPNAALYIFSDETINSKGFIPLGINETFFKQ